MTPVSGSMLALVIVSLGILGVILSFLVPDRKKSLIALGLGGLIILVGLVNLGSQGMTRYRWNKRIRELQRDRTDLDDIRQRLRERSADTPIGSAAPDAKKK